MVSEMVLPVNGVSGVFYSTNKDFMTLDNYKIVTALSTLFVTVLLTVSINS